jgi:hypothetical protein
MRDPLHPVHYRPGANAQAGAASPISDREPPPPWRPRERLSEAAKALMNSLPDSLSVSAIALDYPHVLNRLAVVWPYEKAFEQELWALLFDDRADREGFPFSVEDELLALQAYRLEGRAGG